MEEPSSAKRRKTENINDISTESKINKQWSGNVEISAIPVKPDKLQKLRRIAAKMLPPVTDDVIISSTGSSPSTSPRPENLSALSEPVDPAELFARLTVLVKDENKENLTLKSGDGNLQAGGEDSTRLKSLEEDVNGQSMSDKILSIPMRTEEFYAVLRKMINEKMKQLEDNYNEVIIPNLEQKIKSLESENNYLQEHTKRLQEMLTKLAMEHKKQQKQKPDQAHAAIQVGSFQPPPLTPMGSAVQTVALPNKPAPVIHVADGVSDIYKSPSTTASYAIQGTTLASQYALRGSGIVNGIRHTATASTGHVFTSSAGQPRMYSEAPYKPGSHPNAVVAPHSSTTFARPAGPITATVYPQPQGLPTSPTTLGVRRSSAPIQTPSHRVPYSPQPPNGVMIRTAAQPTVQYVMNAEKSTGQVPGGRPKSSSFQGPPPSYSIANARPQQPQVSYRPGTTTNPPQVNGVRHYAVRQSPPSQGGMVGTAVRSPAGPPPLVRAQPNMRPQMNNPPRYHSPHVIRQRPPYSQITPGNDPRAQATTVTPRNSNVPPLPPQSSPSQTNGVVRDLPPPTPAVSISGAASGIVLSWNMNIPEGSAPIDSYQLFAYQNSNQLANTAPSWKKLGIVKALPLPMACTLTQFVSGSMYYFAVRAIDIHGRAGSYSTPCAITLPSESDK